MPGGLPRLRERGQWADLIADNRIAELAEIDRPMLKDLLEELDTGELDMELTGFNEDALAELMSEFHPDDIDGEGTGEPRATLAERFGVPPFSVLDARQGYWQDRKRAWIALGIQSELGRGDCITWTGDAVTEPGLNHYRNANKTLGAIAPNEGGDNGILTRTGQYANGGNGLLGNSKQARQHYKGKEPATSNSSQDKLTAIQKGCAVYGTAGNASEQSGTSIFDPVLCELAYRWFCPEGGIILDPFAGGSVRGIVAARLGREYVGIDLSAQQIAANEQQAETICEKPSKYVDCSRTIGEPDELTPIQQVGGVWVKRDDLFEFAGMRGGKARTALYLCRLARQNGAAGVVTAGAKDSPQVNIVAHVAAAYDLECRCHVPSAKEYSSQLQAAQSAGATLVPHSPGYNSVIVARCREDAQATGWAEIPFGMECQAAIDQTRKQAANLPYGEFQRIVMVAGSGMSLAGVLWGLQDAGQSIPVVAIKVGADPTKRLDAFAPKGWRKQVTLLDSGSDYSAAAAEDWNGLSLDPHYEAKAASFLTAGDLFWVIGNRHTMPHADVRPCWKTGDSRNVKALAAGEYDMVFSCPPYFDLEIYSDDAQDLSGAGTYEEFIHSYHAIIAGCVSMLKPDRFACFVVGDIRDKKGFYRNFVSDTIAGFENAGAKLYNEAILVTCVGSLPIRIGKQFTKGRKLGKTHQNVLVFYKGDPKAIHALGGCEFGELAEAIEADGED